MNDVMIVTGGSRGIGAATCQAAAEAGYAVVINYASDADAAASVAEQCRSFGADAVVFHGDVSDEAAVVAMFDAAEQLGRLRVLVNNAGIVRQQMRFDQMPLERWRTMIDVNVIGTFLCAREASRRMSTAHGGSGGAIVNVSSASAYLGSPGEYVDYAATKGAIDTLTIGLGRELADEGVRVNAVRPGVVRTDIHASGGEPGRAERVASGVPMQRPGEPSEVAETILWLASDAASYVTATTLDCSGGR